MIHRYYLQARGDTPLTEEDVRGVAPSIFAESRHEGSTSERFTAIPTIQVLRGLREEGFYPFGAGQTRASTPERRFFTRHILRLRHMSAARAVGDTFPEVVVINANDGTTAYSMSAGLFRLVCLNGAVVGEHTLPALRIRHTGDVLGHVIEGAYNVVKAFDQLNEAVAEWRGITLPLVSRLVFAERALDLRYGPRSENGEYPVTAERILEPQRIGDRGKDLWTTFNVVQEYLVRGGIPFMTDAGRRNRTRGVTGIKENVGLNKRLWDLAADVARFFKGR